MIQRRDSPPSWGFCVITLADLGREDPAVASGRDRGADDRLRRALGVDVGGVDEIDAGVERRVDDALRGRGVGAVAEHHRAEAEFARLRDRCRRGDDRSIVHPFEPRFAKAFDAEAKRAAAQSRLAHAWRCGIIRASSLAAVPFRCMSFSRTTASSRPAPSSPTTTPRCRSRRRPASGSRSRRRTCCCASPTRRRATLLAEAQSLAAELDPAFLWEVSGDDEFGFADLAPDYFGRSPRAPRGGSAGAVPARVADAFLQEGQGALPRPPPRKRSRPRSPASSASAARPSRSRAARRTCGASAAAASCARSCRCCSTSPTSNALEGARACRGVRRALHTNPLALLDACGAIPSTHDYHFNRFLVRGVSRTALSSRRWGALPAAARAAARRRCARFRSTTRRRPRSTTRSRCARSPTAIIEIGIHIAAPALADCARLGARCDRARTAVDRVHARSQDHDAARARSIARFTLAAGRDAAGAVALRRDRRPTARRSAHDTGRARADRRRICGSTRSAKRSRDRLRSDEPAWTDELRALWRLAQQLEPRAARPIPQRVDYNFYVDWDAAPDGRVAIVPRPRGSPLDKLVAELMIHVNSAGAAAGRAQACRALSHAAAAARSR